MNVETRMAKTISYKLGECRVSQRRPSRLKRLSCVPYMVGVAEPSDVTRTATLRMRPYTTCADCQTAYPAGIAVITSATNVPQACEATAGSTKPIAPRKTISAAPALPMLLTVKDTSCGLTLDWNIAGIFICLYYELSYTLSPLLSTGLISGKSTR